jgi:UDP-N-acetylmuramoyl-tripeptide--D-alanyl-D-alanine ligase
MFSFLRKCLQQVLRVLAVLTIKKFRPGIVGITGSVGKTSTKQAIFTILRGYRRVRESKGSLNNEFGFPLTILGEWSGDDLKLVSRSQKPGIRRTEKFLFWFKVIFLSILQLLFYSKRVYPEILILEYGADRPGDIKYLLSIAKPNIGVITTIPDVPVHVEFFESAHEVLREKALLVEVLTKTDVAILNNDDPNVMGLKDSTEGHIVSYGFHPTAQVRISEFENLSEKGKPMGIFFKLEHGGDFVPIRLKNILGKGYAYGVAAATAVGVTFGMTLVRIAEAITYFDPPIHRLRFLPGIKSSTVIDDAYNASPASVKLAVETIRDLKAKRKVAILGDMLEIGKYTVSAHEEIGKLVGKTFQVLVTVGGRAKFIAKSAHKAGLPKKNIYSFEAVEGSIPTARKILKRGDLVLVKASLDSGFSEIVRVLTR